jgi:hypothetical protein
MTQRPLEYRRACSLRCLCAFKLKILFYQVDLRPHASDDTSCNITTAVKFLAVRHVFARNRSTLKASCGPCHLEYDTPPPSAAFFLCAYLPRK